MSKKIGVVIGRFQVPVLHPGHIYLLTEVQKHCDEMVIFLGVGERNDERNPLPYHLRAAMIEERFPGASIGSLQDRDTDEDWSRTLDRLLRFFEGPDTDITLYGSRDCFEEHYTGKYPVEVIPELEGHSGTTVRTEIQCVYSEDFRRGIFYAFKHLINNK